MPDMTAAQMVADEVCSGSCLTAGGPHTPACTCKCDGKWHGALRDVVVPESAAHRRPKPPPQPGPGLFRHADHPPTRLPRDVLCEKCDAVVAPEQAGVGYVRCDRCDPGGIHIATTFPKPGGPCLTCTNEPALAGSAPN